MRKVAIVLLSLFICVYLKDGNKIKFEGGKYVQIRQTRGSFGERKKWIEIWDGRGYESKLLGGVPWEEIRYWRDMEEQKQGG